MSMAYWWQLRKRVLFHSFPDLLAATRGHQNKNKEVIT